MYIYYESQPRASAGGFVYGKTNLVGMGGAPDLDTFGTGVPLRSGESSKTLGKRRCSIVVMF
jgi:hypothetical protein